MIASSVPRPNRFQNKPWPLRLALVLLAVLAADLAVAHLYRGVRGYPWSERKHQAEQRARQTQQSYRVPSPFFHHGLAPGVSTDSGAWGDLRYPLHTNSLGLRDREVRDVELDSEAHRILFIGDSFTEGLAVAWEDTFVGVVGDALAPGGVEVLNAAVVSYSPTIYWRKVRYLLEEAGLRVDEVVVFLDVSDAHDEVYRYRVGEDGNVVTAPQPPPPERTEDPQQPRWLRRHSIVVYQVVRWIQKLEHRVRSSRGASAEPPATPAPDKAKRPLLQRDRAIWTRDDELFDRFGREGLERMAERMDALLALLRERDVGLTVAIYPWPDHVLDGEVESAYTRFWHEWSWTNDVDLLDYFPRFVPNDPGQRREILETWFVPGDMHWSARGHRVVADGLLQKKNW